MSLIPATNDIRTQIPPVDSIDEATGPTAAPPITEVPASATQGATTKLPDDALSTDVTTTQPVTDLLESVGVLSAGAAIPLLWATAWASGGAIAVAVGAFVWARARRQRKAVENEEELRKPRYVFSKEQLIAAASSGLPPEVVGVLNALHPDEKLSRGQLLYLLSSRLGDGRTAEALPLVLRFARTVQSS